MKKHLAMAMLPVAALFWLCWQAPRLLVLASNQLFPIIQTQVVSITKEFFSKQEKSEYSIDLSKMGEGFKKPEICDTYICESQLEIRVIRKDIPYDPAEISPEKFFQIVDMGPLERADGIIKGMERDAAFLAQTVLMYRGLLDTKPTGSWLHQSEKALARLEYLKGYAMTPAQAKEEILALAGRMAADPDKTPSKSSEQRAKQTGSAAAPDAGNTAGGGYLQKNPLPSSFEPSPGEPGFDRLQTNEYLSNLPKRVHVPANINPSPARYGIGGEIKLFPISGE